MPPPIESASPLSRSQAAAASSSTTPIHRARAQHIDAQPTLGKVAVVSVALLGLAAGVEWARKPTVTLKPAAGALSPPLLGFQAGFPEVPDLPKTDPWKLEQELFLPDATGARVLDSDALGHAIRTYHASSVFDAQYVASVCAPALGESMVRLDACFERNPDLCRSLAESFGVPDCSSFERLKSATVQHVYNVGRLALSRVLGHVVRGEASAEPLVVSPPPGAQFVVPESFDVSEADDIRAGALSPNVTTAAGRLQAAIVLMDHFLRADQWTPPVEKLVHEKMHAFESAAMLHMLSRMQDAGEVSANDVHMYREMMAQAHTSHWLARAYTSSLETVGGTHKLFFDTLSYATGVQPLTQAAYEDGLALAVVSHFTADEAVQGHMVRSFLRARQSPLPHTIASIDEPQTWHVVSLIAAAIGAGLPLNRLFETAKAAVRKPASASPATIEKTRQQLAEAERAARGAEEVLFIAAHAGDAFTPRLAGDVRGVRGLQSVRKACQALADNGLLNEDWKMPPETAAVVKAHLVPEGSSIPVAVADVLAKA